MRSNVRLALTNETNVPCKTLYSDFATIVNFDDFVCQSKDGGGRGTYLMKSNQHTYAETTNGRILVRFGSCSRVQIDGFSVRKPEGE